MVEGKRIILGVSGGIAAYKAIDVCRRLVDAGAHVIPVLTDGALRFVGRTTFDALASERAWTSLWDEQRPIPHTHLGQTADLILVAPATARILGLYAGGISDDLLLNTLLATRAPVVVCPAMHTEMWEHPSVQDNIELLRRRGVHVVEPRVGRLAGGDVGAGRLAEPADIVAAVESVLRGAESGGVVAAELTGLRALVTAGGTREPIDPVRFIGNRSSGKQGHAVAEEAAARGAKVTLVTTTNLSTSPGIDVVPVDTAAEMERAVLERADESDVIVMAAAVADFRPVQAADRKLKKAAGTPDIVLEPTVDILAALGGRRRPGQTIVGFAAETDDLQANAADKLARKGIDLIVANDVSAPGTGFEHDTNAVVILDAHGGAEDIPLTDKRAVARAILDAVSTARSSK
ncbi:MAG: bifunctional phosphopantothenoylcysteine decarboxylase/phosphopantothenate--cysteine ligase CoaBC [Acidimicrobiales bacterium]